MEFHFWPQTEVNKFIIIGKQQDTHCSMELNPLFLHQKLPEVAWRKGLGLRALFLPLDIFSYFCKVLFVWDTEALPQNHKFFKEKYI